MILSDHFPAVLVVTGIITASPVLQFLAPAAGLKALFKLEIADEGGSFFARHWGLLCGVLGVLLIHSASHPEVRRTIVLAALVEKAILVVMIALAWNRPYTRGMRLTAIFDGACSLLYAAWLLQLA
jgi:hypothetical protein